MIKKELMMKKVAKYFEEIRTVHKEHSQQKQTLCFRSIILF